MVSRRLTGLPGSSQFNAFEQVPLGGGTNAVKLVDPLAGRALDLEGTDSHKLAIGPFPSVASQDMAERQRGRSDQIRKLRAKRLDAGVLRTTLLKCAEGDAGNLWQIRE